MKFVVMCWLENCIWAAHGAASYRSKHSTSRFIPNFFATNSGRRNGAPIAGIERHSSVTALAGQVVFTLKCQAPERRRTHRPSDGNDLDAAPSRAKWFPERRVLEILIACAPP
jgi:hypothetical protein